MWPLDKYYLTEINKQESNVRCICFIFKVLKSEAERVDVTGRKRISRGRRNVTSLPRRSRRGRLIFPHPVSYQPQTHLVNPPSTQHFQSRFRDVSLGARRAKSLGEPPEISTLPPTIKFIGTNRYNLPDPTWKYHNFVGHRHFGISLPRRRGKSVSAAYNTIT